MGKKVRQLKESLLGWGGYKSTQEKIYLDKRVVYMRGSRSGRNQNLSGTFYKWHAKIKSLTSWVEVDYYTKSRTPEVGDYAYYGTDDYTPVLMYDSSADQIIINAGMDYATYVGTESKTFEVYNQTEKIYPVNFDGTQNTDSFTIKIDHDNTTAGERFFFDKPTQCLIRTAVQSFAPQYGSHGVPVLKRMVIEAYDPNTLELLDQHIFHGYSNQDASDIRLENCSQGLYAFYCNGIYKTDHPVTALHVTSDHGDDLRLERYPSQDRPGTAHPYAWMLESIQWPFFTVNENPAPGEDVYLIPDEATAFKQIDSVEYGSLIAENPTVFIYSTIQSKMYKVDLSSCITQPAPENNANGNATTDCIFNLYNQSDNIENVNNISIGHISQVFKNNDYTRDWTHVVTGITVDLTTNPATLDPITITTQASKMFNRWVDLYPNYPYTKCVVMFAPPTGGEKYIVEYNKYAHSQPSTVQESTLGYFFNYQNSAWKLPSSKNGIGGMNSSTMVPQIGNGSGGTFSGMFSRYDTLYNPQVSVSIHNIQGTSSITATSDEKYFPKFLSGPKRIIPKPKRITSSGVVLSSPSASKDYIKSYDDECFGYIINMPEKAGVLIFSKTERGAIGYDSTNTTPRIAKQVIYKGETYYVGLFWDFLAWAASVNNVMDLPYLFISLDTSDYSTNQDAIIQVAATIAIDAYYNDGYETPFFYTDNSEDDVTKYLSLFSLHSGFKTYFLIDSLLGYTETNRCKNTLSRIPTSEQHVVLTSTDKTNAGSSDYARYINLYNTVFMDNGSDFYEKYLQYTHKILDCNTNTQYQADNPPVLTSADGSDGGFAIPPVAIADGDLVVDYPEYAEHYYAWKRMNDNQLEVIFTNSMNSTIAVGYPYFMKVAGNLFERAIEDSSTIISSLTPTYLTTQAGVEYTRVSDYDWVLEHSTNTYVPYTMVGWDA